MKAVSKNRIRAVFLDMDGTVYSHTTNRIPQSAYEAVRRLGENGIAVFIATGRHMQEIRDLGAQDLPVTGWITLNGAYCFAGDTVFHKDPIPVGSIEILLDHLRKTPFPCQFLEAEQMYINLYDAEVERQLRMIHTPYPEIRDADRALRNEVFQLIPWVNREIWDPIEAEMDVRGTRWTEAVDVVSKTCGKDAGLGAACRYLGITREETLAVGDGPNDAELLNAAGHSAAMGNATDSLRQIADYVSSDIDEDGLYKVMEHYHLIGG